MTTPDQLDTHADTGATPSEPSVRPPAARSRRHFWRVGPVTARAPQASFIRVFRPAMACRFEILLPAEATADVSAAREALGHADRLEQAWSIFRSDSQLSRINQTAATGPVPLDAELAGLLIRCQALGQATGGAVDVTATPLSRCWGLVQREGRVPTPEEITQARAVTGAGMVVLRAAEPDEPTVAFSRPGVELNLGAIGKGYAVGCIAAHLRGAGVAQALVSAGDSSVEAVGAPPAGWPIAMRGLDAGARLWLRHGAMATSGAGEQGISVDGVRYGHVIDPRTGWPARGVARVTVIAADAADADALATAFLVGGPALAARYLADHDDVLVVFALDDSSRPRIMGRAPGATVEV